MPSSRLVVVAGPTASGKSRVALAIAEAFGGIVINADSMQVYRELHLLTARPSIADEARVPHRLFGCLSAAERCSAGRWQRLALTEIATARGVKMAEVALAWVLQKQPVSAPIVGVTKLPQLTDALAALDLKLSADEIAKLEAPYQPTGISGFS